MHKTLNNCAKLLLCVLTKWLPIGMIYMDVIRSVSCVHKHLPIWPIVFVSLFNCLGIPVSPINSVFKNGNSKGMRQSPSLIYRVPMGALQIRVPGVEGKKSHSVKTTPLLKEELTNQWRKFHHQEVTEVQILLKTPILQLRQKLYLDCTRDAKVAKAMPKSQDLKITFLEFPGGLAVKDNGHCYGSGHC